MQSELGSFYNDVIAANPLLSEEREIELLKLYQKTKSKEVRDKIVYSNLRLVIKVASKYINICCGCFSFDDLVSFGIIGLIKSIDKFDLSKKCKFSTYAYIWIKQSINQFVDVQEIRDNINLNVSINDDDKDNPVRFIRDDFNVENIYDQIELRNIIMDLLNSMDISDEKREMYILWHGLRDGKKKSLTYLSKKYGITCQSIFQSLNRITRRIQLDHSDLFEGYICK